MRVAPPVSNIGREEGANLSRKAVLGRENGNLPILRVVHFSDDRLDRKGDCRVCSSSAPTYNILQNFRFKPILDRCTMRGDIYCEFSLFVRMNGGAPCRGRGSNS